MRRRFVSPDCVDGQVNCTTWADSLTEGGISPEENKTDAEETQLNNLQASQAISSWPLVKSELEWAFPLHIYGFALLFCILAFYTFFSILNLRSQLTTRPFMSTINVFVCVLGVSRTMSFLVDSYGSLVIFPRFVSLILWDFGYPCILSAFCLIQLAFSQLTQMKFRPESLRRETSLSIIIIVHFLFVLGSDISASFDDRFEIARTITQNLFICWGVTLCMTFLYGGTKLLRLLKTLPNSAFQNGEQVEHKGILQLALLAQCNNIASSVITAAAPSMLAPKIKITDENNQTFSVASEASKISSSQTVTGDAAPNVPQINITKVESPVSPATTPNTNKAFPQTETKGSDTGRTENSTDKTKDPSRWKASGKYSLDSDKPPRTRSHNRRKKSLTWSDGQTDDYKEDVFPGTSQGYTGATLGQGIQPPRRQRGGSDSSSSRRSSSTSTCSSRKNSSSIDSMSRKGSYCSISSFRHGSFSSEASSRKDSLISEGSRKGSHIGEALVAGTRRSSATSDISSRRNSHNLGVAASSRRGSSRSIKEEAEGEQLIRKNSNTETDLTLTTILNHIAYANQTAGGAKMPPPKFKESRKEQVKQVLVVTYFSAILGMLLSILLCLRIVLPQTPVPQNVSWAWFAYETVCRLLEFLVGCAMANITRQPANRPTQYGYSLRMKPRNSIYM